MEYKNFEDYSALKVRERIWQMHTKILQSAIFADILVNKKLLQRIHINHIAKLHFTVNYVLIGVVYCVGISVE